MLSIHVPMKILFARWGFYSLPVEIFHFRSDDQVNKSSKEALTHSDGYICPCNEGIVRDFISLAYESLLGSRR